MPHIRIRGLDSELVKHLSEKLVDEVSEVTGAPVSHFTLEYVHSDFFVKASKVQGEAFCEVLWFSRDQSMQDRVAQIITAQLKKQSPEADVVVVFLELSKTAYYENGIHF